MTKIVLEIEKLRKFPDSFLEYFLTQENISEVSKVIIRDILEKRSEEKHQREN
jgi:hypothetical protein|tara:strand:+ start:155 stop:313 length:159 start_codon:yes stop_codon:yes gene_type:complete